MLDLVLMNKEGLVRNVKIKGSYGCSDLEIVEFKILRAAWRAHSKLTIQYFRRADLGLFRDLLGRISWDKAMEGRGPQESCLIFKDHLLQAQKRWITAKRKRQAKSPGSLHGSKQSSWTNSSTKRKSTECGSKDRYPGRNTEKLPE